MAATIIRRLHLIFIVRDVRKHMGDSLENSPRSTPTTRKDFIFIVRDVPKHMGDSCENVAQAANRRYLFIGSGRRVSDMDNSFQVVDLMLQAHANRIFFDLGG